MEKVQVQPMASLQIVGLVSDKPHRYCSYPAAGCPYGGAGVGSQSRLGTGEVTGNHTKRGLVPLVTICQAYSLETHSRHSSE